MARARRTTASVNGDAQTTLGGTQTTTTKTTRARRSADEEIALCEAKLAAARDRKMLEDVKDLVAANGVDKRFIAAFTSLTRLRAWLSTATYDAVRSELGAALHSGRAPESEPDDEESDEAT